MLNMAFKQRSSYGKRRENFTPMVEAEKTLYYYGVRYLDPKTSHWLSGDPAMGEYFPSAPVNDEAKKRNGNLPGQGGVFNNVNLHAYHYAGNNPVKYVDPDGKLFDDVIQTIQNEISQFQEDVLKEITEIINNEAHIGHLSMGKRVLDIGTVSVSLNLICEYKGNNFQLIAEVGADLTLLGRTINGEGAKITIGFRQSIAIYDKNDGGYINSENLGSRIKKLNLAVDASFKVKGNIEASLQLRKYLFNFSSVTSSASVSASIQDIFLKDWVVGAQFKFGTYADAYRLNVSNALGYGK